MKNLIFTAFVLVFIALSSVVQAASDISAFQHMISIPEIEITEPTVAELSFPANDRITDIVVIENESGTAQPVTQRSSVVPNTNFSVTTPVGNGSYLTDSNRDTFIDFPLSTTSSSDGVTLELVFERPTLVTGVFLEFSDFSRSPDTVAVVAQNTGQSSVVVATTRYTSPIIRFPQTTATNLSVTLTHSQPIRVTRVGVYEDHAKQIEKKLLRFLAKPGKTYTAYVNPDRKTNISTTQVGDLFSEPNPVQITQPSLLPNNPQYVADDKDEDGIPTLLDNCPLVANPEQSDSNANGVGDLCDDTDYDGVINSEDNCPHDANSNQSDVDGDGIGDVCDDQESRFTEQYPWLPWIAMGGTAVVITVLVLQMSRSTQLQPADEDPPITEM